MQLQELRAQIREHAQAAFALLPQEVTPPFWAVNRGHMEQKAERGEWVQVLMMVESFSKKSSFSPELLHELSLARQAKNRHDFIAAQEMMEKTSDSDKQVIGECLHALAHGPFITDDGELHNVTGLNRAELVLIAEAWPHIKPEQQGWTPDYEFPDFISLSVYAVGQTLNNLLRYPHHKEQEWPNYLSTPQEQVEKVENSWRELRKKILNS